MNQMTKTTYDEMISKMKEDTTVKYKMLTKYDKRYVASSDGKLYKIKKGYTVDDDDEITIGTDGSICGKVPIDKLKECKYYYDEHSNTIKVYLCIQNDEGKKYYKKQLPSLIGRTFHPFSHLPGNEGHNYVYKQIDNCFDNNHVNNLIPKVLLKKNTKKEKVKEEKVKTLKKGGFTYYPHRDSFLVRKTVNGIRCFIGWFKTEEEAQRAYNEFTLPSEKHKQLKELFDHEPDQATSLDRSLCNQMDQRIDRRSDPEIDNGQEDIYVDE